jgi:PAS domain S-box-containing protein
MESRLRAAVESAPTGLIMTDADGRIVLVNREIERLFGYAREELHGQAIELLLPHRFREHHPASRERFTAHPRARAMGAGRDLRGRRKDGSEMPVEVGLTPVATDDGLFVIGSVVDISERLATEEAQRLVAEQLRQAQKMEAVGTLAGGIAHDFNNLLGAIMGYAELVQQSVADNEDISADVQEIIVAAQRGRKLVQQILIFSRRQQAQRVPVSLASVVREVQQLLRASLPVGVNMEIHIHDESSRVLADSTSVHQVIMNLATNAAQAMPNGGQLQISLLRQSVDGELARLHAGLREGDYIVIEVRDNGVGMDEATRERAMEPFFTTKAAGEGTGLGLSMVHGIMQDHGGALTLESSTQNGTTARCLFPARADDASGVHTAVATSSPKGEGQHILYVDDEQALATLGERRLRRQGYAVTAVTSPAMALEMLTAQPNQYAMVITDYSMPEMNGLDLAKRVRAIQPAIPILLLTGYVEELPQDVLATAGIHRVLQKPVSNAELADICAALLATTTEAAAADHTTP